MSTTQVPDYKVIFLGDGGSGKSSLVHLLLHDEFQRKYIATLGVDVHPYLAQTNKGPVRLSIWDTAGQEKFGGLRDGYYLGAKAAVLFFDMTAKITFKNLDTWYKDYVRIAPGTPIILVGNKADIRERRVTREEVQQFMASHPAVVSYLQLSVKTTHELNSFLPTLLQAVTGDQQLSVRPIMAPGFAGGYAAAANASL